MRTGASDFKFGKDHQKVREELLGQMTAEERLTAFEAVGGDIVMARAYEEILIDFGHSSAEIERMLPG